MISPFFVTPNTFVFNSVMIQEDAEKVRQWKGTYFNRSVFEKQLRWANRRRKIVYHSERQNPMLNVQYIFRCIAFVHCLHESSELGFFRSIYHLHRIFFLNYKTKKKNRIFQNRWIFFQKKFHRKMTRRIM